MEDYIYILLGIAWVAYSLYSARQKALRKQQSSGLPPRGPSQSSPLPIPGQGHDKSVFEEIFRELSGETRPVVQEIKPVAAPKPVRNADVSELNQPYPGRTGYKFVASSEAETLFSDPQNTITVHPVYEQMTKKEEFKRNFNLREAVIYSELLNRKYF